MTFIRETEFITVQNDLYQVIRKFKESSGPMVDKLKEFLDADKVFRIGDEIAFCRLVKDAEIVNDDVVNDDVEIVNSIGATS